MNTRTHGWLIIVVSLLGALSAVVIIGWSPEVTEDRFSYPFGTTSYVVAQTFFALRDLLVTVGLIGLAYALWTRADRLIRVGLVLAIIGMALFVGAELFAITASNVATDSSQAEVVSAFYGAPMTTHGIGLVLAGIGLARKQLLPGALGRWIVLICGVYVFVVVFPSLFGPMVVGRLGIGSWLLIYAGIGLAMVRYADRDVRELVAA